MSQNTTDVDPCRAADLATEAAYEVSERLYDASDRWVGTDHSRRLAAVLHAEAARKHHLAWEHAEASGRRPRAPFHQHRVAMHTEAVRELLAMRAGRKS